MINYLDEAVYMASWRLTADAGSATVQFNLTVPNGTRIMIDTLSVFVPNTASGRSIYVRQYDENNKEVLRYSLVGLDNKIVNIPSVGTDATNGNNITSKQTINLVNTDYLAITGFTLDEDDYLDIVLRGVVKGRQPNYNTTGSNVAVTLTANYVKIV